MKSFDFILPESPLQDSLYSIKLQTAQKYAMSLIEVNKECFVAQWVMQNQDKNIDDYVLCYQYSGDVIKFWMQEKDKT